MSRGRFDLGGAKAAVSGSIGGMDKAKMVKIGIASALLLIAGVMILVQAGVFESSPKPVADETPMSGATTARTVVDPNDEFADDDPTRQITIETAPDGREMPRKGNARINPDLLDNPR